MRGAFFNPAPTCSIYCGRASIACQMLGFDSSPSSWIDSGAHAAIKGLIHARDFPDRFGNFALRDLRVGILRRGTIDIEFGRLCYLGFIFPLRIQSEAYPAIRASFDDDLLNRSPMRHPVLLGIRDVLGEPKLSLKLSKRENGRELSILSRPRFCLVSVLAPSGLCPVRNFRPVVRRAVEIDGPSPLRRNKKWETGIKGCSGENRRPA